MWIRTQDKGALVQINNAFLEKNETVKRTLLTEENFEENNDVYKIFSHMNNMTYYLGTYNSKERAIEVLDEIQERISPKFNYKGNNEEADLFIKTQILNSMIAVYQMPEK